MKENRQIDRMDGRTDGWIDICVSTYSPVCLLLHISTCTYRMCMCVYIDMYMHLFVDSQTRQATSHTKNSMPRNMLNMSSASAKLAQKTADFSILPTCKHENCIFQNSLVSWTVAPEKARSSSRRSPAWAMDTSASSTAWQDVCAADYALAFDLMITSPTCIQSRLLRVWRWCLSLMYRYWRP